WKPGVPLGEVTSRSLDQAARLQKAGQAGEVVASWEAFRRVTQRSGFLAAPKTGPLAGTYCWSEWQEHQQAAPKAATGEAPLNPAAAPHLQAQLAMQSLSAPRESAGPWLRFVGIAAALAIVGLAIWGLERALVVPQRTPQPRQAASPAKAAAAPSGA